MFDTLGNIVDTLFIAIFRDLVLFSGIIISWLYWRKQVSIREDFIADLKTNINYKNADLNDYDRRLQELDTESESLNTQLSQREETIHGLTAQIKEKDNSINLFKEAVDDLEKQKQNTIIRVKDTETRAEDLKKRTQEQEIKIKSLNTQLSQREGTLRSLTVQIKEKDNSINLLKEAATDLEKKNQNSINRAEDAEARVRELENSIEAKEKEIAALIARSHAMQDNFETVVGIGPKVSAVLRSAGIKTFAQLASKEVTSIKDILEAENPNLLRLTDPTTWPEQARMAAEGDWEALSALQKSLKGGRQD